MELPKVLSLSTDRDLARLRERAKVLEQAGFDVVSVTSVSQALFEIMRGHCGIFISCPLISDVSTAAFFKVFKKHCPNGLSVFVIGDEIRQIWPTWHDSDNAPLSEARGQVSERYVVFPTVRS